MYSSASSWPHSSLITNQKQAGGPLQPPPLPPSPAGSPSFLFHGPFFSTSSRLSSKGSQAVTCLDSPFFYPVSVAPRREFLASLLLYDLTSLQFAISRPTLLSLSLYSLLSARGMHLFIFMIDDYDRRFIINGTVSVRARFKEIKNEINFDVFKSRYYIEYFGKYRMLLVLIPSTNSDTVLFPMKISKSGRFIIYHNFESYVFLEM